MALSTIEVEYMAAVEARKVLIWMRDFLSELGMKQEKFTLPKILPITLVQRTFREGITGYKREWMKMSLL